MIERIDTLRGFRAIRAEWEALYTASGVSNVFLTHAWLEAWIADIAEGFVVLVSRPHRGAAMDAGVIFATHEPRAWCYVVEHSYRPGVLCRPDAGVPLRQFLLYIAAHEWHRVRRVILARCPDTEEFRAELGRTLGPLEICVVPGMDLASRIIETKQSYEEYLTSRPAKVRQELKRKIRQLDKKLPQAEVRELPASAGTAGALEVIAAVEADSWKADAQTAIICSDREKHFYGRLFALESPTMRGRLFYLRGADKPIAYVHGVEHDGVFYALKTSYRADHASLAPGQVLFGHLIEHFCDREPGVRAMELLGNDSRWKRELATTARHERTFEVLRPDPLGLTYALGKKYLAPLKSQSTATYPALSRMWQQARALRQRVHGS